MENAEISRVLITNGELLKLVKNNSGRIKDALKNGIEPNEVATEIAKDSMNANTPLGYKKLNFVTKLISKMKRKQRKKALEQQQIQSSQQEQQIQEPQMNQELGGIQKVYTNNNN